MRDAIVLGNVIRICSFFYEARLAEACGDGKTGLQFVLALKSAYEAPHLRFYAQHPDPSLHLRLSFGSLLRFRAPAGKALEDMRKLLRIPPCGPHRRIEPFCFV